MQTFAPHFHPNAPDYDEFDPPVGTCDVAGCEVETDNVIDQGVDHDETGPYGWIVFRCTAHEEAADAGDHR